MWGDCVEALASVARDGRQRLVALGMALALVLAGVPRAFLEMSAGGIGSFPMPGDNLLMLVLCVGACVACCAVPGERQARAARTTAGRALVTGAALVSVALLVACRALPGEAGAGLLFWAGALVRVASLLCLIALRVRAGVRTPGACAAQMAWAVVLAVALDLAFLLLAPVGVAVVGLLAPLALGAVLRAVDVRDAREHKGDGVICVAPENERCGRPLECEAMGRDRGVGRACAGAGERGRLRPARAPWGRLAMFGLYGLVGGITSGQAHALGAAAAQAVPSLARTCLVNDLGLLAGAAVLLAGVLVLGRRGVEPFALRYLVVPVYLIAIFLAPLMSGTMALAVPVLMAVSQVLFYGLLWAQPCAAPDASDPRWFAAACGAFFGGTYLAMWFGGDLLPTMASGDAYMVVAAVLLGALLVAEFAPRLAGSGSVRAGDARMLRADAAAPEPGEGVRAAGLPADGVQAAADGAELLADLAAEAWASPRASAPCCPGFCAGAAWRGSPRASR